MHYAESFLRPHKLPQANEGTTTWRIPEIGRLRPTSANVHNRQCHRRADFSQQTHGRPFHTLPLPAQKR